MNKKIIVFILFLALSLCFFPRIKTFADEDPQALVYLTGLDISPWEGTGVYPLIVESIDIDNIYYFYWNYNRLYGKFASNSSYGYMLYAVTPYGNSPLWNTKVQSIYVPHSDLTAVTNPNSGHVVHIYTSMDDFNDSLPDDLKPQDPSWYEELFNDFIDYIGAGLTNGIDGFLDWLREAWITPVGEGEDELFIDLVTPTPTPTPLPTPTPIPYETQLVPDGNGGFNIQYVYINPSGVPTSAPQPPTNQPQPTGSGLNDNDFDYPYYDNPNNKDDPYTLDIPWYLKFSFGGAVTSLDDFQEGMDAIVDNVNDQDENISVVMDSMGLFPSDWLLMIGFIGAIPLVGGLISRLLKG